MSEVDSSRSEPDSGWLSAFGQRLQKAREDAGMSQDAVAEQLGFPTRSLTRWENGKVDPGAHKVMRLAQLYGVSIDWLAGRSDVRPCIKAGAVLIDAAALRELEQLADNGARLRDVPRHLLRPPGVNCVSVVPTEVDVVSAEAAQSVGAGMQRLWSRLGGSQL